MSDFIIYYAFAISRSLKFGRTSLKCAATALLRVYPSQQGTSLERPNFLSTDVKDVMSIVENGWHDQGLLRIRS